MPSTLKEALSVTPAQAATSLHIQIYWCIPDVCSDHTGNLSAYCGNFTASSRTGFGSSKNKIYHHPSLAVRAPSLEPKANPYRSIGVSKPIQPLRSCLELLCRYPLLQYLSGHVPQLLVILLQQHEDARRLAVEGARRVQEGVFDHFGDLRIWDRGLGAQLVVGPSRLDQLSEWFSGCHSVWEGIGGAAGLV